MGARTHEVVDSGGFAVHSGIRNNPVREVDRVRHRAMWGSLVGLAVLVAAVLVAVWQHSELRRYGYEIERLQRERAAVEKANRQLWLELEMLRSPSLIERLATERLKLVPPGDADVIILERVRDAARPSGAIVAQR
ncbi:MAG: cell division protein FtsL [Acidobacteriota bacterium]